MCSSTCLSGAQKGIAERTEGHVGGSLTLSMTSPDPRIAVVRVLGYRSNAPNLP